MKISGGIAKGRRVGLRKAFVKKSKAGELRPTSSKVRQAIFNILRDKIIGASFLDLYAGTGAVGIEALSRGAGKATFIDDNALRVNVIKELIEKFGFKDRAVVIKNKALNFLRKTEFIFDIIFVDPPYASGEIDVALPLIDDCNILKDNGIVIAEHSSKKTPPLYPPLIRGELKEGVPLDKGGIRGVGGLRLIKTYNYGDTSLTLYKKEVKVYIKVDPSSLT